MPPLKRSKAIGIFVVVSVVALLVLAFRFSGDSLSFKVSNDTQTASAITASLGGNTSSENNVSSQVENLIITDIKLGQGIKVTEGDEITVHYSGRLDDGREFVNSQKKGSPLSFRVNRDKKIVAGLHKGVVGMQPGGVRTIVVPARLGYGEDGFDSVVPPEASLVFQVTLIEID